MGCIPSVNAAACSGSFKFSKQFCSLAIGTKGYCKSSFNKVEKVEKRGFECAIIPKMSSARKGMEVEMQHDQECADLKEGDIINLSDLIFDENRDYLVKYNKQQVCTLST
ncbi:hypothetical protein DCAR_0313468 [Daucus carota subsp. sativus]|uniref:Uncharacterized protein n=1 Tax=Daucus carota subsp. sativus TaxID=79200 RepID=A0AAF0WQF0_DAUCS|nr:PREDICTED: uncharacterized protein LOC108213410 [Daucus carota subsp. sativus]WOG94175.1 hypothetical protein DCAR_0313468 [Daucus carota subsp. sativus]